MDIMEVNPTFGSPILAESALIHSSPLEIHTARLPYSPNTPTINPLFLKVPSMIPGILDDVKPSGWLDAMKSSSPPHGDLTINFESKLTTSDADLAYKNWLLKYPSVLSSFEQLTNSAKGKKLALFLDYDGTLSPIVDNPDKAYMPSAMREAVRSVAKYFPTAIISGRSNDKVYEFVKLKELYYAGSHGMDIMRPVRPISIDQKNCRKSTDEQGKAFSLFQPASEFLPMINEVFRSLVTNTKDIDGTNVENNKFCISVHYRNVEEKSWPIVAESVTEVLKHYPRLRLTHGRKVLEVRPVLAWDKGKAVQFLLESLDISDSGDVLPIYIGDDRTDEDAFKVLREMNRGFGVLVSSAPKDSNALYSLKDPSEVLKFLKKLVLWKKSISKP